MTAKKYTKQTTKTFQDKSFETRLKHELPKKLKMYFNSQPKSKTNGQTNSKLKKIAQKYQDYFKNKTR
jgi:hypothetical protein